MTSISAGRGPLGGEALTGWIYSVMWGAIIVPTLGFLLLAAWGYQRAVADAEAKVTHASALSLRQAERIFEVARKVASLADEATLGSDSDIRSNERAIHQRFADLCAGLGFVVNLNVWGADGSALVRSDIYPADPGASVANRQYFLDLKTKDIPVGISEVLSGRQSGRELFNLTIRRQSSNGRFNGIVAVSLAPESFRSYYSSLTSDEPELASFAIDRADGTILARWPVPAAGRTRVDADNPVLRQIAAGVPSGLVEVPERDGRESRLISFRRVEGLPVYVTAGFSKTSVIAGWLKFTGLLLALFAPITLGLVWVSWVALRKTREEAQRTAERDRIWKNSRDIITVIDLDGTLLSVNPAATTILGWAADEMIGRPVMDFIHAEDQPPMRDGHLLPERYERPQVLINRLRRKDGRYSSISWSSSIEDDVIYSQGRDITLEVQQAEALKLAEEAARQSQKMEAVGQLTGGIAHDFNNLLTAIGGSLQLMRSRIDQGRVSDIARYANAAEAAVTRAAALTHRLLAFSRRPTLDPKPVNVNRLLAGIEDLIRRTTGPSVDLEIVGAGGLWAALVDPNQLENAILNLCINARDAMPDGGRITIETANKWIDDREARWRDVAPGQYLSICVTDTGTGMTPEVQEKAFEPFFTTKPLGTGTGLGLSMIYGFAKQSGGQVRIYSEVAKGSTICIYLPRYTGDADEEGHAFTSRQTERPSREATVVVVDDESTVRMLITDVLEEDGYEAIEAQDGRTGLAALRAGRVDLLITDVGLPGGMNGRQLADAARVADPALKVLFITGYAENAVVGNGHLEPGMSILTKPFDVESLRDKVHRMLKTDVAL